MGIEGRIEGDIDHRVRQEVQAPGGIMEPARGIRAAEERAGLAPEDVLRIKTLARGT